MLEFRKTQHIVERLGDGFGHLSIRILRPNQNICNIESFQIIHDLIRSKFHFWSGEIEPEGLTVGLTKFHKELTLHHHKFYGFFDNNKIVPEDYIECTLETCITKLTSKIEEWSDNMEDVKAVNIIADAIGNDYTIYHLDLDENKNQDKVSEWHVYFVFTAFLAINRTNNTVALIEFGDD